MGRGVGAGVGAAEGQLIGFEVGGAVDLTVGRAVGSTVGAGMTGATGSSDTSALGEAADDVNGPVDGVPSDGVATAIEVAVGADPWLGRSGAGPPHADDSITSTNAPKT